MAGTACARLGWGGSLRRESARSLYSYIPYLTPGSWLDEQPAILHFHGQRRAAWIVDGGLLAVHGARHLHPGRSARGCGAGQSATHIAKRLLAAGADLVRRGFG